MRFDCSIYALKMPFQEWPIKHAQANCRLEVQELLLSMLPAAADVELVPGAAGRTPPAPAPCLPVPALVDHIHSDGGLASNLAWLDVVRQHFIAAANTKALKEVSLQCPTWWRSGRSGTTGRCCRCWTATSCRHVAASQAEGPCRAEPP